MINLILERTPFLWPLHVCTLGKVLSTYILYVPMPAPVQKKFEVIRIGVGAIMAKQDYAVADLTFLVVSREGRVGR